MSHFHFDCVDTFHGLQPVAAFECRPDHDLGFHWPITQAAEDADFLFASVAIPDAEADVVVRVGGREQVYGEDATPRSRVSSKLGITASERRRYPKFDFHTAVCGAADFAIAGLTSGGCSN